MWIISFQHARKLPVFQETDDDLNPLSYSQAKARYIHYEKNKITLDSNFVLKERMHCANEHAAVILRAAWNITPPKQPLADIE